jgi:hypothetical protein
VAGLCEGWHNSNDAEGWYLLKKVVDDLRPFCRWLTWLLLVGIAILAAALLGARMKSKSEESEEQSTR